MARILIADDDPDIRDLLQLYLEHAGHEAVPVGSGLEALEMVRQGPFDVALVDIHMVPMDGLQTAEELRKLSVTMRIGMITAANGPEMIIKAVMGRRYGVTRFLPKPLRRAEVLGFVSSLLAESPSA